MKSKAPKPLLIIFTVALVGFASVALYWFQNADHFRRNEPPMIHITKVTDSHLLQLFGKPKRAYLVSHDVEPVFPCHAERPAPFSVSPRPDAVLFML